MRAVGVLPWLCLLMLSIAGCGSGSGKKAGGPSVSVGYGDDAGADAMCVDNDGDGFGDNCEAGDDCNDNDPTVTDECRRCVGYVKGCPCEPGTQPVSCQPAAQHVAGGTLVCKEGNRYCRDGFWSDCETIAQYVTFIPDK